MLGRLVIAPIILLAIATTAARGELIVNGSFEVPDIPGSSFQVYSSIPGWTATAGEFEIQDFIVALAYDGSQLLELDGFDNSSMEQVIPTAASQSYQLSFAYSPRPGVAASSNGIDVYWDGGLLASLAEDGTDNTNAAWTVHSFSVAASTTSTSLKFVGTGTSDALGGFLDAVSLVVPEPSALGLASWAALLAVATRRRRRP